MPEKPIDAPVKAKAPEKKPEAPVQLDKRDPLYNPTTPDGRPPANAQPGPHE